MTDNEKASHRGGTKATSQQTVAHAPITPLEHAPSSSDAKTPALLNPPLAEIFSAIDHLRAQQDAMRDSIQTLAGGLHVAAETHMKISQQIDTARSWAPRLQELIETMIAQTESIERESRQETSKLRDEMRERHDAQQRNIADVCASLNRLEARIIPALRRVSSANRAMTIMVERLSQIEKHYARPDAVNPERSELGGSEQAQPPHRNQGIGTESGIVSELKQLISDLEDATADPPSEVD